MISLNNIKISKKLPAIIVACALIASLIIGEISYLQAKETIIEIESDKLMAVLDGRMSELHHYLDSIKEEMLIVADNPFTIDATSGFEEGWNTLGSNAEAYLQKAYITNNPNPAGEKHKLDYADDNSTYTEAHADFHPWFRELLEKRGYFDIFILSHEGDVIYSVFKEADYATDLVKGKWSSTDLATIYKKAYKSKKGEVVLVDFAKYAPSNDAPASFMATKIYDYEGELHGILVFQMPIGKVNGILSAELEALGESGETFIIGQDNIMRSDSRFSNESTILVNKVDTLTANKALKGGSGVEIIEDYRGINVFSAYDPFEYLGVKWAMIAEMDESEVLAPLATMRGHVIVALLIMSALIILGGIYVSGMIVKPIALITKAMEVLSTGDTSVEVPAKDRGDEVGDMANALEVFKQNRIAADKLEEKQKAAQAVQVKRAARLDELTKGFEKDVSELINTLSSATTELDATAQSMSSIAEETTSQSTNMSKASETTSSNI